MELLQGQFASPAPLVAAWGEQRVVKAASPGAGLNFTQQVLGGFAWNLVAVRFTLTTGAEAGERFPALQVQAGDGTVLCDLIAANNVTESKAATFSFVRGGAGRVGASNASATIPMPELVLEEGWQLRSQVQGLLPLDKLSAVVLWVEESETMFDHTPDRVRQAVHEAERVERTLTHG